MVITRVRLIPKRDDLEAIIEQYGDVWDVHLIRDNTNCAAQTKGPWLLVTPMECSEDHKACRWVHINMDLKFDVRFNLNDED